MIGKSIFENVTVNDRPLKEFFEERASLGDPEVKQTLKEETSTKNHYHKPKDLKFKHKGKNGPVIKLRAKDYLMSIHENTLQKCRDNGVTWLHNDQLSYIEKTIVILIGSEEPMTPKDIRSVFEKYKLDSSKVVHSFKVAKTLKLVKTFMMETKERRTISTPKSDKPYLKHFKAYSLPNEFAFIFREGISAFKDFISGSSWNNVFKDADSRKVLHQIYRLDLNSRIYDKYRPYIVADYILEHFYMFNVGDIADRMYMKPSKILDLLKEHKQLINIKMIQSEKVGDKDRAKIYMEMYALVTKSHNVKITEEESTMPEETTTETTETKPVEETNDSLKTERAIVENAINQFKELKEENKMLKTQLKSSKMDVNININFPDAIIKLIEKFI